MSVSIVRSVELTPAPFPYTDCVTGEGLPVVTIRSNGARSASGREPRGGLRIAGQERLQAQFGDGHVERGSEVRERGQQPQLPEVAPKPQRHREADVVGAWVPPRDER